MMRASNTGLTAATDNTATSARIVTAFTRAASMRRLIRLPNPVPSSSENSVTVSE